MTMTTEHRISDTRRRLLLDEPWFGALALRLQIKQDDSRPTMATNGTDLIYNAAAVDGWSDSELRTAIAHETLHCALKHPYEIGQRNVDTANRAMDYVVNAFLKKSGFTLPSWMLYDAQYEGMHWRQVYRLLEQQQQEEPGNEQGEGQGEGEGAQDVIPAPGEGEGEGKSEGQDGQPAPGAGQGQGEGPDQMTADDWDIAVEQVSAVAKKAGSLPGCGEDVLTTRRQRGTDWRAELQQFVTNVLPSEYLWSRPNRRLLSSGIYLPGAVKENMPAVGICIDTSGSIDQHLLDVFGTHLNSILHETRPEAIHVFYADTKVRKVETFTPDDTEIVLTAPGRGGTRFQPTFDFIAEHQDEYDLAALIYFTDLENRFEELTEPSYPVMWATAESVSLVGDFGQTIRVSEFE